MSDAWSDGTVTVTMLVTKHCWKTWLFEYLVVVQYVTFVHGLQAGVYNPVEGVLNSMIHDSPHVLLSHPHMQQMMMLPYDIRRLIR